MSIEKQKYLLNVWKVLMNWVVAVWEKGINPIDDRKPTLNERFRSQNPHSRNKITETFRSMRVESTLVTLNIRQRRLAENHEEGREEPEPQNRRKTPVDARMIALF